MFDDVGRKIMSLTKIVCMILIVLCCIAGLFGFIGYLIEGIIGVAFLCLLAAGIGCLFAWIGGFLMYGLGQLIDDMHAIRFQNTASARGNDKIGTANGNKSEATMPSVEPAFERKKFTRETIADKNVTETLVQESGVETEASQDDGSIDGKIQNERFPEGKNESTQCEKDGFILFGRYPQNVGTDDKGDIIRWDILKRDITAKRVLLISHYALDSKPYCDNTCDRTNVWEQSTLRKWLNRIFINLAFSEKEQNALVPVRVNGTDIQISDRIDTADRIFLLSLDEVEKYYAGDKPCMCAPTEYAISQGAWVSSSIQTEGKGNCCWWLRSPGKTDLAACSIGSYGKVNGGIVSRQDNAVRPALWLDLTAI